MTGFHSLMHNECYTVYLSIDRYLGWFWTSVISNNTVGGKGVQVALWYDDGISFSWPGHIQLYAWFLKHFSMITLLPFPSTARRNSKPSTSSVGVALDLQVTNTNPSNCEKLITTEKVWCWSLPLGLFSCPGSHSTKFQLRPCDLLLVFVPNTSAHR